MCRRDLAVAFRLRPRLVLAGTRRENGASGGGRRAWAGVRWRWCGGGGGSGAVLARALARSRGGCGPDCRIIVHTSKHEEVNRGAGGGERVEGERQATWSQRARSTQGWSNHTASLPTLFVSWPHASVLSSCVVSARCLPRPGWLVVRPPSATVVSNDAGQRGVRPTSGTTETSASGFCGLSAIVAR